MKDNDEDLALRTLGLALTFLDDALITDKTIKPGTFKRYTPETQEQLEYMVLDSQSLHHLEILETPNG